MKSSYRPEIDGFRALAVTSVVLFHAKIPGFSNGFAGVDIFFVISGFLITSIIARERSEGRFFYSRFVMRRVRRILPALILVMLSCIPLAWCLMLPDPLENFGQSLLATVLSSNNILLWLTSGYWDLVQISNHCCIPGHWGWKSNSTFSIHFFWFWLCGWVTAYVSRYLYSRR